ncbi:MAG: hypothetical protein ACI9MC_000033 [Kiritimatiellia bacterium]
MEFIFTIVFFGLAMSAMAIGVIVSNRSLRGSCGGPEIVTSDGEHLSCGACPRKEVDVCPSDDALVQIAQIGHPNPRHHR